MRNPLTRVLVAEVGAGVELLQLRPGERCNRVVLPAREHLLDVRRARRGVIVKEERDAVGAQLHVDLEEAGTGCASVLERGDRVLGRGASGPAVPDQNRCIACLLGCGVCDGSWRDGGECQPGDSGGESSGQAKCHEVMSLSDVAWGNSPRSTLHAAVIGAVNTE